VTFQNRAEAYDAVEHANDDTSHPPYQMSFGGRRAFCKREYADLDFSADKNGRTGSKSKVCGDLDFDSLLKAACKKKV
jgi:hypothetical protein